MDLLMFTLFTVSFIILLSAGAWWAIKNWNEW